MRVYSYTDDDESGCSSALYEHSEEDLASNGTSFVSRYTYDSETTTTQEQRPHVKCSRENMLQDSWDFYRLICSLLRDWHKYEEAFQKVTNDPLYPYLNSITGLNDTAEIGILGVECTEKLISQRYQPTFEFMSRKEIVCEMIEDANVAILQLIKVCQVFAKVLGLHQVGIGPVKEVNTALRKAERKYKGDALSITDYCRALLVVKDIPTLLAAIEFASASFRPLIRRIKLSSLKYDNVAIPGGYRDCKINMELQGHICEIQIHLWPLWKICGVHGFRHYRHCLDYAVDSTFEEPFDVLKGISDADLVDLIAIAENTISKSLSTPTKTMKWYHEERILSYFAKAGLYYTVGTIYDTETEGIIRDILKLRCDHPEIGPNHIETIIIYRYLERVLRRQGKIGEADVILHDILNEYNKSKNVSAFIQNKILTNSWCNLTYETKNKYIQRTEVIMESYSKWNLARSKKFELYDNDVGPAIMVQNAIRDCPSSERQWWESLMS